MTTLEQAARQALNTLEIAEGAFAFGHIGFLKMIKSSIADLRHALENHESAYQREWVGLTVADIKQGFQESWVTEQAWSSAVWWAEQRLKELNT